LQKGVYMISANEPTMLENLPVLPWGVSAMTGTCIGAYLGQSGMAKDIATGITSGDPLSVGKAVVTVGITYYLACGAKSLREAVLPAKYNTPGVARQCLGIATAAGLLGAYAKTK
jgi:hypothetical protein